MKDNDIVEGILDLLGFLILFGVCISVAVKVVMPALHQSMYYQDPELTDKTAPPLLGYEVEEDYDGKMSKLEVVLAMRVQDQGLPQPNKFKVGSSLFEALSNYESMETTYAQEVFRVLHATDPTGALGYRWDFNYGAPPTIGDLDTGNLVTNPKAESHSLNYPTGWNSYTRYPTDVEFTVRQFDQWVISGSATFEIRTTQNVGGTGLDYTGYYYQNIDLEDGKKYRYTATISCHRCEAYISVEVYDTLGNMNEFESARHFGGAPEQRVIEFTAPVNASHVRLKLVKDVSRGASEIHKDHLFADDVSLQILDGADPHYYLVSE